MLRNDCVPGASYLRRSRQVNSSHSESLLFIAVYHHHRKTQARDLQLARNLQFAGPRQHWAAMGNKYQGCGPLKITGNSTRVNQLLCVAFNVVFSFEFGTANIEQCSLLSYILEMRITARSTSPSSTENL